MRSIILLMLVLIPSIVLAGGITWKFRVENITMHGADSASLELSPIETGAIFPLNCKLLTVQIEYSTIRWWFFGGKDIDKANHRHALQLLGNAKSSKDLVRFGSMGEGFGFDNSTRSCTVRSRALTVIREGNGTEAIYSYYKWP